MIILFLPLPRRERAGVRVSPKLTNFARDLRKNQTDAEKENISKDLLRTEFLKREGFKVIRFWNNPSP